MIANDYASNLTIGTGNVNFDVQFDGQTLGTANLDNLVITPGSKSYATNIHFQPSGGATQAGKTLLENYISGIDSATTIQGTRGSTPIDSLKEALSEVKLSPVRVTTCLYFTMLTCFYFLFPGQHSESASKSHPVHGVGFPHRHREDWYRKRDFHVTKSVHCQH